MGHTVLGRNGRVIRRRSCSDGRERGKDVVHRSATAKATQPRDEDSRLSPDDQGGRRRSTGRLRADKPLMGHINEQIVPAEKIRAQNRLLHVRQKKFVHYPNVGQIQGNVSGTKCLYRGAVGRDQTHRSCLLYTSPSPRDS